MFKMLYFGGNLEMFDFNYYQVLHAYRVCSLWDWCNSDGGDAGGGRHQLVQTSGLRFIFLCGSLSSFFMLFGKEMLSMSISAFVLRK